MCDVLSPEALARRIRDKAYIAFIKRAGRDSHGMNPGKSVDDFQAEYDRLETEARACQPHQSTRPHRSRFAADQRGVPAP